jgi:hypothetical protein
MKVQYSVLAGGSGTPSLCPGKCARRLLRFIFRKTDNTLFSYFLFICTTFKPDYWLKSNSTQFIKKKYFVRKIMGIASVVNSKGKVWFWWFFLIFFFKKTLLKMLILF